MNGNEGVIGSVSNKNEGPQCDRCDVLLRSLQHVSASDNPATVMGGLSLYRTNGPVHSTVGLSTVTGKAIVWCHRNHQISMNPGIKHGRYEYKKREPYINVKKKS